MPGANNGCSRIGGLGRSESLCAKDGRVIVPVRFRAEGGVVVLKG